MKITFDTDILEEEEVSVDELISSNKALVLYNDDVNTFDFVIESLIKVCRHDLLQAEQCTFLIHYKGQCAVKNGSFEKLKPMCEELLERGLSAKIEN
jgi:ATP-dependent Clp protease adaptor protein ClpS